MKQGFIRVAVALWFIGMVGLAIMGNPKAGEAEGVPRLHFPLMTADAPGQLDPDFHNYVGVGISDADGDLEIYTVRGDSSELRQITDNDVTDRYPSFSPNGSQIVFTREIPVAGIAERRYQVVVVSRDGSSERVLWEVQRPNGLFLSRWSPRSQHLLVVSEALPVQAWIIGLDGSVQPLGSNIADFYSAEWSPDGRYVSYRGGPEGSVKLYVTNVATGAVVMVGENVVNGLWAPDSRDLLVVSYFNDRQSAIVVQPDGSGERVVFDGDYIVHGWVRNGSDIVVESNDPTNQNFYLISRGGGAPVPLTTHTDSRLYGIIDPTKSGLFYDQAFGSNSSNLYWIPFDTKTPRFIAQKNVREGISSPALSQDRTRLVYSLNYCENRSCSGATYHIHLDDPAAIPQTILEGVSRFLPNSSNRAAVQFSGYPTYSLNTINMVQIEPLTVTSVAFTDAVEVRSIAEWRYLP